MGMNVQVKNGSVYNLLPEPGATGAVTGNWIYKDSPYTTYEAVVLGGGAVSATVVIEVTNYVDPLTGIGIPVTTPMGTITLSGTNSNADGFTSVASWKYHRARVTAVTGTLQVYAGV